MGRVRYRCCVPRCNTIYFEGNQEKERFFRCPDPDRLCAPFSRRQAKQRLAAWRKVISEELSSSSRICSRHFVSGQPAPLTSANDTDWIPTLFVPNNIVNAVPESTSKAANTLNKPFLPKPTSKQPPSGLPEAEKNKPEQKEQLKPVCCLKHCENRYRPSSTTKIFPFPKPDTTNYVTQMLSEKRLLIWLQMVDQVNGLDKVDICKLYICSLHFATGTVADLVDVENVDWIPTINLNKTTSFTDHVDHFDLYSLISLVKESSRTQNCTIIDGLNLPQPTAELAELDEQAPEPVKPPSKPKLVVGLKCILCLRTSTLKALTPIHRHAINTIFKDIIGVESELICTNCSKYVMIFFGFFCTVLNKQERATCPNLKNVKSVKKRIAPAPPPSAPVEKKMRSADEKGSKLYDVLTTNEFYCKMCKITLATRPVLNDHLFFAHKVKITCRFCRQSFSPEDHAKHKTECSAKIEVKRQAQEGATDEVLVSSADVTTPKAITQPKYAKDCKICKETFTPAEMIAHVKTHEIDSEQVVVVEYEVCTLCEKSVQKQNMSRHLKAHESQQSKLKNLIQEQQEKQRFHCPECPLEFKTVFLLERHKTKHNLVSQEDKIECPDCNRVMIAAYFKRHVELMHDTGELLPCDKCGKQFTRGRLKNHRATTCGDDAMVTCEHCGKLMREYLLKGHISKVHSNRTVKCRFCPKEFDSREYAHSHERWSHRAEHDKRKREGVKRLDRDQLEEALGLKTNPNEEENSTCPVCFNYHGTKAIVEQHVRKAHYTEYKYMVPGGIIESIADDPWVEFDPEGYVTELLQPKENTATM